MILVEIVAIVLNIEPFESLVEFQFSISHDFLNNHLANWSNKSHCHPCSTNSNENISPRKFKKLKYNIKLKESIFFCTRRGVNMSKIRITFEILVSLPKKKLNMLPSNCLYTVCSGKVFLLKTQRCY